ncbi:MAG: hypothetical protein LUC50_02870 [Ruminococcus sp.]|nr:hypothetical protein [Ruminococcus sp.]
MKQKKILSLLSAAVFAVGILGSLPEEFTHVVTETASTAIATAATTLNQIF